MIAALAIAGAGLALGLAGSGHCALMCGPLVLLAQPRGASPRRIGAHMVSYHAGRIFTYAIAGALVGATGGLIAGRGFGRALAIAAAVALVAQAIVHWKGGAARGSTIVTRAIGAAGQFMRRHTIAGPAVFGAASGLLPCGLIYAALTAAIGLGGAAHGAAFMVGFGLGSLPVLAAIGISAQSLGVGRARILRRLAPAALAIVAIVLVARAFEAHAAHNAPAAQHHLHQ